MLRLHRAEPRPEDPHLGSRRAGGLYGILSDGEVQKRDGEELAKKYRYLFFECSAKTNENIKYMFYSSIMNLQIFKINNENENEKEILIKKLIEEDKNESKNDSQNIINSVIHKIKKYKKIINKLKEDGRRKETITKKI